MIDLHAFVGRAGAKGSKKAYKCTMSELERAPWGRGWEELKNWWAPGGLFAGQWQDTWDWILCGSFAARLIKHMSCISVNGGAVS